VSSFLQNAGVDAADQTDVLNSILAFLASITQQDIKTCWELSALITTHCIEAFNYNEAAKVASASKIVDMYDASLQSLVSLVE
jgi:hypothetical protein